MARTGTRLQAVGVEDVPELIGSEPVSLPVSDVPRETPRRVESALTGLLITSLRALSQRTLVALASLIDLALIGSAFTLWLMTIAFPTPLQLVGVGVYAIFVLVAIYMRRD